MDALAVAAVVGDAERDRVRAISPLAADMHLQCGPALLPAAVAGCTADAERQDGVAGDALRSALAEDPWAGMGSLAPTGWLLAAANSGALVFVHRRGDIGVGQVLVLQRHAGQWKPSTLSGARLVVPGAEATGARIETVLAARPCSSGVELVWSGDGDLDGAPQRRVDDVRLIDNDQEVHVLVITVPLSAADSPIGGEGDAWVAGVGVTMRTTVDLASPLGERWLLDNSRIPAVRVATGAEGDGTE